MSTSYHPQSDGQTEVVNRCLENYLRCMCTSRPKEWADWLPLVEYWYNTNHHSALGRTPFEVLYGQKPPVHVPYLAGDSKVATVEDTLCKREEILREVKGQLKKAQERMKRLADQNRREEEFQVGDWVYLKLQPFRQKSLPGARTHKLSPKYVGPFCIMERIEPVVYRLKLPEDAQIHNVFHVSLLRRKVGEEGLVAGLPELMEESPRVVEPEEVLDRGLKKANGRAFPATIWLIKWKGLPRESATWELAEEVRARFPEFQP